MASFFHEFTLMLNIDYVAKRPQYKKKNQNKKRSNHKSCRKNSWSGSYLLLQNSIIGNRWMIIMNNKNIKIFHLTIEKLSTWWYQQNIVFRLYYESRYCCAYLSLIILFLLYFIKHSDSEILQNLIKIYYENYLLLTSMNDSLKIFLILIAKQLIYHKMTIQNLKEIYVMASKDDIVYINIDDLKRLLCTKIFHLSIQY